jgi:hypothetical protein
MQPYGCLGSAETCHCCSLAALCVTDPLRSGQMRTNLERLISWILCHSRCPRGMFCRCRYLIGVNEHCSCLSPCLEKTMCHWKLLSRAGPARNGRNWVCSTTTHGSTSGPVVSPVLELESWHFCLGLRVSNSFYFLPTLFAFTEQSRMNSVAFLEA